jgi:hypothetical protein
MSETKPILIFTHFWDAEYIISRQFCIAQQDSTVKMIYLNNPLNYTVNSIALTHPNLDSLPLIQEQFPSLKTLNFFCPTYEILKKYKEDKDWDYYTKKYKELLVARRDDIKDWVNSLEDNKAYILCCWENTSRGANCHRVILYNAISHSKTLKDKVICLYRDGGKV